MIQRVFRFPSVSTSRPAFLCSTPMRGAWKQGALLSLVCVAALAVSGCAGSTPVEPSEPAAPEVGLRSYRTVVVDSKGRADHEQFVCYLAKAQIDFGNADERGTHVVYVQNERFIDIGYFLASGATYRLEHDREGNVSETFIGNHEPSRCVELLTGTAGPFRFITGV